MLNQHSLFQAGPQQTLYIPGALLKPGDNNIIVLESYHGSNTFKFTATPNYGTVATTDAAATGKDKENPLDVIINLI